MYPSILAPDLVYPPEKDHKDDEYDQAQGQQYAQRARRDQVPSSAEDVCTAYVLTATTK